jgi:hypothetical protein
MKVGKDKWKHFFVGILLGMLLHLGLDYFFDLPVLRSLLVSLLLMITLCYGFEILSLVTGFGHYEWADAVSGMVGGAIGITLLSSVQ